MKNERIDGKREVEDKLMYWLGVLVTGGLVPSATLLTVHFVSSPVFGILLSTIVGVCMFAATDLLREYLQRRKARRLARDGKRGTL